MSLLQPGDHVRVVEDKAGHNYPRGTEFIVKTTRERLNDNSTYTEIRVENNSSWFYETDLILIYPPNKNPGKYIITDPIFIMNKKQYEEIKENHEKYKEPDYEHLQFPIKSTHNQTKEPIIIHYIETTPYGEGECEYEKQSIINHSGMLCIAENPKEWLNEKYGARFETLQTAQDKFQTILNKL